MNWKLKCLALHAIARAPSSVALHRWLQRRVTGRFWDEITPEVLGVYEFHVRNFLRLPSPQTSRAMEFGAGRSLTIPLLLSAAGAAEVLAYDIEELATVDHVNHVIRQLRGHGVPNARGQWREIQDVRTDLARFYDVRYRAPGDARRTELGPRDVDFICSTSTLEHIDQQDIRAILAEGLRISSPNALVSFIIDYHDHYASTDASITRFNFYRYSDKGWKWFNPPNHFQNRLRHSDYETMFRECGFTSIESRSIVQTNDEAQLRAVSLCPMFARYSSDDLLASNGFFLLRAAQ